MPNELTDTIKKKVSVWYGQSGRRNVVNGKYLPGARCGAALRDLFRRVALLLFARLLHRLRQIRAALFAKLEHSFGGFELAPHRVEPEGEPAVFRL